MADLWSSEALQLGDSACALVLVLARLLARNGQGWGVLLDESTSTPMSTRGCVDAWVRGCVGASIFENEECPWMGLSSQGVERGCAASVRKSSAQEPFYSDCGMGGVITGRGKDDPAPHENPWLNRTRTLGFFHEY